MHGRVKSAEREKEEKKSDDDRREELTKVRMYHEVVGKVLALKKERVLAAHVLPLTSHLLLLNPEFHIIWGYRRETVDALIEQAGDKEHELQNLGKTELKLTFDALQRNPKSYCAWFHRQWIVNRGVGDLHKEIALCNKLLELDERNFHCWNYRRHVSKRAGVTQEQEFEFSTVKIAQNFSNYSVGGVGLFSLALHHRSITLPTPLTADVLFQEIELVQQAVFTEPDDQSAWFYYRWLLTSMMDLMMGSPDDAGSFLDSQIAWMEELREMEEQAKWVLVTLADVYTRKAALTDKDAQAKAIGMYRQLIELDPDHRHYYEDMAAKSA
ncbi:TPA: hypothetical protein N0F65_006900 [Lagenidium giganteum]|uniref:Geranylgeranyl transferase type-2 subunit alpha n=1 Tax=Lagenidium giganteum TaxID=4803 RepID=A0AAV2ZD13_9STRA|nr:TPA: hypothetical protein N0F65_006900 [Lagenidium giganteum]